MVRRRQLVIMMHRFAAAGAPYYGHEAAGLRNLLAYLRRCGVALESVDTLVARAGLEDGAPLPVGPSVAFTVDDGYADVAELAQPIFAEFECPFTVFVVPNAVEGKQVFWWDQLAWMMRHGRTSSWQVSLPSGEAAYAWHDDSTAFRARKALEEQLKGLAPNVLASVLADISRQADVPLLSHVPNEYRVLGWEELRTLERKGGRVGAHSMSHPILSRCTDAEARWEIMESLARVRSELLTPSAVFCYPNGRQSDFSDREGALLAEAGMLGALSSEPGIAVLPNNLQRPNSWRWQVPRMAYDSRPGTVLRAFFG